ncbi:tetratricopeptide repeat protein [archaeon]|nr:MAG: tetratricopeptide repeat protein [archaeon]
MQVLESYCSMGSRNKLGIDRALQSFSDLLEQDPDYLPAVLGMATCFMINKDQHKARNLLKRVGKLEQNEHDGEDFEKANLLLAKFYIDKAKPESAQEVCRKLLLQNKSCSQAWEILGLIFEKDANYDMAADAYVKAWQLEFEASAPVGFKLAFSYLKSRRLVEAVDVCSVVLKQYPDYPRIKDEILNKALSSMRTSTPV